MIHCEVTPTFDLTDELYGLLLSEINDNKCVASVTKHTAESFRHDLWSNRLLNKFLFTGSQQSYLLSDTTEQTVLAHYKNFINFVNSPYKIRLNKISDTRWIPPHVDSCIKNGNRASIYIGIKTNGEMTNWYSCPNNTPPFNITKLKKTETVCLTDKQSILFDNGSIHSVTNCFRSKTRWALAISWQEISFDQVRAKYQKFIK